MNLKWTMACLNFCLCLLNTTYGVINIFIKPEKVNYNLMVAAFSFGVLWSTDRESLKAIWAIIKRIGK